jgi:hypothetical protein
MGYVGDWRLSDVRHGTFSKRLKDPREAMAAVKRLDGLTLGR